MDIIEGRWGSEDHEGTVNSMPTGGRNIPLFNLMAKVFSFPIVFDENALGYELL